MFNALDMGNFCYLRYEIWCDSVAVRHIQMMKRAAASFLLSLFCLLMAIQLAIYAVLIYFRYGVGSKVSVRFL
jgi:hypothetical protein